MRNISSRLLNAVLLVAGLAGLAQAEPVTQITIVNGTDSAIVAMQVRPSGATNAQWTALTPGRPLGIQGTVPFQFSPANCYFDVQAQFADGRSLNKPNQHFCRLPKAAYIIRAF
jgi:hypothetical protein